MTTAIPGRRQFAPGVERWCLKRCFISMCRPREKWQKSRRWMAQFISNIRCVQVEGFETCRDSEYKKRVQLQFSRQKMGHAKVKYKNPLVNEIFRVRPIKIDPSALSQLWKSLVCRLIGGISYHKNKHICTNIHKSDLQSWGTPMC